MQMDNYIQVDAETLVKAEGFLSDMPEKVEAAYRNALLRARGNVRSNSTREITKEYAIRPMDVRAEQNVKVSQARSKDEFVSKIIYSGARLPISRFDIAPKSDFQDTSKGKVSIVINGVLADVYPGKPLKARIRRDHSMTEFRNAFAAKMKSGHIAAVERRGIARLPLGGDKGKGSQLYGPSVSQMLDNMDVKESLTESAQETFQKRFEHEIDRMVAGWGMK